MAELSEKFKAETKNSPPGQLASDSKIQGTAALTVASESVFVVLKDLRTNYDQDEEHKKTLVCSESLNLSDMRLTTTLKLA